MGSISQRIYEIKNNINVKIRDANVRDAEKIIQTKKSIVREGIYMLREIEETNYTIENEQTDIKNHFNNVGSLYIVAEAANEIAGLLEFQNGGLKRTAHAGMFTIFILKKYREMGIGKLLLETLLQWAEKNILIEKVTLNVFSTNERAQNLYKKLGFIEEGRCPKDMKLTDGTYIDSILMYKFVK